MTDVTAPPVVAGLLTGLGISTALPIDGAALFGAILGAWLVASVKRDLKVWQRVGSMLLSTGMGYLFAEVVQKAFPILGSGPGAAVGAVVVVPIGIKLMLWVEKSSLFEILNRVRGGR
ncbi:putative holin [Pseudomonas knackmussii]|uniref:putative holin n=1 Tax=Pseudomonas knackmussii TaxID=65741 RepID=UPI003F4A0E9E